MGIIIGEARQVFEGLTRNNYFPNQKEIATELPPFFNTRQFTPEISSIIAALPDDAERRKLGYDRAEYLVTRYDNVPRLLSLVHPKAYSQLVNVIVANWDDMRHVSENKNSFIKPEFHVDGRLMIMNYEDISSRIGRELKDSYGKRFRVHTDIASCFHSIYTHSIPWAVKGFDTVKSELASKKKSVHWSDELDRFQRRANRCETQGIPIGPATSSVVVELVLGAIDKKLIEAGFEFNRHIDDYVCYCKTYEQAQNFILVLSEELRGYKLNLNLHKTKIVTLPEPTAGGWISELTAALPSTYVDQDFTKRKLTGPEIIHFLDKAVRMNNETPDGSVLKYAVSSVIRNVSEYAVDATLDYVANLAWHYPVLLPFLDTLLSSENIDPANYSTSLHAIAVENAIHKRSDGMSWPLFLLSKHSLGITDEVTEAVLGSKDCISILCLYLAGGDKGAITKFAEELIEGTIFERDQYWPLLYQLYSDDLIKEPYGDKVFDVLKKHRVDFCPKETDVTLAENYCLYLDNPFIEGARLGYTDWLEDQKRRTR